MSRAAFLVPFFGPWPPYFGFWTKSCEINHEQFHWYVYSDQISAIARPNAAVTLIPYHYDDMIRDFARILDIRIPSSAVRKLCDFRILFYFLRCRHEPLDSYDFIGYTDMDMLYGRLQSYLPRPMGQYALISADNDAPCGPFTLIQRHCLTALAQSPALKACLQDPRHYSFNESAELLALAAPHQPVHCRADSLQPALSPGFNYRKVAARWHQGEITVWDNRGHKRSGGFYHFSRYKSRARFNVHADALNCPQWGISKYGIRCIRSRLDLLKLRLAAL